MDEKNVSFSELFLSELDTHKGCRDQETKTSKFRIILRKTGEIIPLPTWYINKYLQQQGICY